MKIGHFCHQRIKGINCRNNAFAAVAVFLSAIVFLTACGGGGGSPSTFSISGTVSASAGNVIDSDVNDLNTTPVSNDNFDTAQDLTSPAVVGGYVNVAGAGPAGNSRTDGDASDFFSVPLTSGQSVRLSLPAGTTGDIELHLFDSVQAHLTTLVGVERMGLLDITADDTYFLEVRAVTGASSYKLIVGDAAALTATTSGFNLAAEFVPGQAIVRWQADTAPAATSGRLAMSTDKTVGRNRFHLMRFDTQEQVGAVYGQLSLDATRMAAQHMPLADSHMQRKYDTLKIIQALRQRDDVEIAEPNYIRRARLTLTDPLFPEQWHYNAISLPAAWVTTTGNPGVIVAVIDTGVLIDHPDLTGQLVAGYDFISDLATANDGDGPDDNPDDPGDGLIGDSSFHGTHVAGTVAAAMNNGEGGTGVAAGAKVMPIRVLGVDGGTDSDIVEGILFAAGLNNQTTDAGTLPVQAADIINMSFGGSASSAALDAAIRDAREAGVIIVSSAGNASSSRPEYPAASSGVISVAATDFDDQRTYYTNFGTSIDVAAPGGDSGVDRDSNGHTDGVLSTGGSDASGAIVETYLYAQGTSMSSPHMAGVVALMKSVRPGLTPDELDAYLVSGSITDPLNDSGLGAGRINALKAVTAAGDPPPTVLKAMPNTLNFESASNFAVLELEKLGSGALTVTTPFTDDAAWLSVTEQTVDPDKLGTYSVEVDRSGLGGGIHTATIGIVSTINSIQVPVRLEVLPDADADAGYQYILLVNADSETLVKKQPMNFAAGVYRFSFTRIAKGNYLLFTGTDLDNDGRSLDQGEAFGAYASAARQTTVVLNRDIQVSFSSGFSLDPFFTANRQFSE